MRDINMEMLFRSIAKQALVACALATPAAFCWPKSTVSVSVHGVNYSNETFSYSLEDPNDQKGATAGELVDRFAAGGTVCCYDLPKEWQPGIRIKVNSIHWLKKTADNKLPKVKQVFVVEVPPYVDGKPGELWVLRKADGTVEVVSSDYQPDHQKWPGNVKGWPVPSLEYRRERADVYLSIEEGDMRAAEKRRANMQRDMQAYAERTWLSYKAHWPKKLENFQGPADKSFHAFLLAENDKERAALIDSIKRLKESRP